MRYFAKIKYLGTDFHGFQVQPEGRTVQGVLCSTLAEALGVPCRVTGCSRTDAGVHANEFCIRIDADGATVPADRLPLAVARFMPTDLCLYYAVECDEKFHPRYDVISKEYLYRIRNSAVYDPFDLGRAWFVPRKLDGAAIDGMRSAAEHLVGKRDFSAFMSDGSDTTDTVRNIFYIKIEKNDDLIEIRICADGFLYNMVRIIVGTLVEVGHGRFTPARVKEILDGKVRSAAGPTAPAEGLYLNKVNY
ncbi:MAG: tRNA pseudouridine(38-40) synthase TruA [Clostridia bacterium]|nr:tRNA pseudouridine(38-40) synthase TruA [Clostridia bacterium]